jgi:hypothetical protein
MSFGIFSIKQIFVIILRTEMYDERTNQYQPSGTRKTIEFSIPLGVTMRFSGAATAKWIAAASRMSA